METIRKTEAERAGAAFPDGAAARAGFRWQAARARLDGLPGGGLNIAHEALARHVAAGHGGQAALRILGPGAARREIDYAGLDALAARMAALLARNGLGPRARLATLLGPGETFFAALLGALRGGLAAAPLSPGFGPEPVRARLAAGSIDALVTTAALYRRCVAPWRHAMPGLRLVLVEGEAASPGCVALGPALAAAPEGFPVVATGPEDKALIHFAAGPDGRPRGLVHSHDAVVAMAEAGRIALDLRPGEAFWCMAGPGGITATVSGLVAPLVNRATLLVHAGGAAPARWPGIAAREGVGVWLFTPATLGRLLRAAPRRRALPGLRLLASAGPPPDAAAVLRAREVLGRPAHESWSQAETGGMMIANTAAMDIRPGALGKPLPGIEAAVVARGPEGPVPLAPGATGELALRPGWPAALAAPLDAGRPERPGGWHLTGDLARRDAAGRYWFAGRADGLVRVEDQLIHPAEIEAALAAHPAVAGAAATVRPGTGIAASVTLGPGHAPSPELRQELLRHARRRLGPALAPREIAFRDHRTGG